MERQTVASVIHGSRLFGTSTPASDIDFKVVALPSAREILLGEVDRSAVRHERAAGKLKNSAGDTDHEEHDLLRYTRLLASGQPVALEMLFAPDEFHLEPPHPVWHELRSNVDRVVSREAGKFLGYCRQQAILYSMKGERMAAAEAVRDWLAALLESHGRQARLAPHLDAMLAHFKSAGMEEFVNSELRTQTSGRELRHLHVCGRLVTETVMLPDALRLAEAVVKEYGERARRAKEAGGHDWKALSHAVRIGHEAVELLSEGRITLPRPEAPHLLDIKLGRLRRESVGDEILGLLSEVETLAKTSTLPVEADKEFLEGLVMEAHREIAARSCDAEPAPPRP